MRRTLYLLLGTAFLGAEYFLLSEGLYLVATLLLILVIATVSAVALVRRARSSDRRHEQPAPPPGAPQETRERRRFSRHQVNSNLFRVCTWLVVTILWLLIFSVYPHVAVSLLGFTVGTLILAFGVVLIPGVAARLTYESSDLIENDREGNYAGMRNPWRLFIDVQPGRIIPIMRGGNVIRYLMNWDGKRFRREGTDVPREFDWALDHELHVSPPFEPTDVRYWDVISDKDDDQAYPQLHLLSPLSWWTVYVKKVTGLTFTGIPPFQQPYHYELELTELERVPPTEGMRGDTFRVIHRTSVSNHVRALEFLRHIVIERVETRDGLEVTVTGIARLQSLNPMLTLFATERWERSEDSAIRDRLAGRVRTLPTSSVLMISEERQQEIQDAERALARDVETLNDDLGDGTGTLSRWGLYLIGFQISQFDPHFRTDDERRLFSELWQAQQAAAGTRIRGAAEADAESGIIRAVAQASRENGEHGLAAQQAQAVERAAAAGSTTIVMPWGPGGGGSQDTAILTQILAELRRNRGDRNGNRRPRQEDEGDQT